MQDQDASIKCALSENHLMNLSKRLLPIPLTTHNPSFYNPSEEDEEGHVQLFFVDVEQHQNSEFKPQTHLSNYYYATVLYPSVADTHLNGALYRNEIFYVPSHTYGTTDCVKKVTILDLETRESVQKINQKQSESDVDLWNGEEDEYIKENKRIDFIRINTLTDAETNLCTKLIFKASTVDEEAGILYQHGGASLIGARVAVNHLFMLNLKTLKWERIGDIPDIPCREGHSMIKRQNSLILFAGDIVGVSTQMLSLI